MLPLTLIAALPLVAAAPAEPPAVFSDPPASPSVVTTFAAPSGPEKCADLRPHYAGQGAAVPRRLDELPPGRLELTVLRTVDNCPIPAVVRENIAPQADGPPAR